MIRLSWTSACLPTTWCVETVRSSTMATPSALSSGLSQVTPQETCHFTFLHIDSNRALMLSSENVNVNECISHFKLTPAALKSSASWLLTHHALGFLCCHQLSAGVPYPAIMSMNFTRSDSTGEKRTREDQSTLSTSRLSLWR